MKPLYIIGSGGFSKQVIEIVEEINSIKRTYKLIGIIDDNLQLKEKKLLSHEVVGNTEYLHKLSQNSDISAVIAIGDGKTRQKIADKLNNINWINLIHPKAIISKYTTIGTGNIICAGVIINPMCTLGNHCNINIGCTLGHDVNLDDFTTLMPGCNISGYVNVDRYAMIGTGSCVLQNQSIGEGSTVGAGAVVTSKVDQYSLYVGIPARKIKDLI